MEKVDRRWSPIFMLESKPEPELSVDNRASLEVQIRPKLTLSAIRRLARTKATTKFLILASSMPPHVATQGLPKCELESTDGTLMRFGLSTTLCLQVSIIIAGQPRFLVARPVAAESLERSEPLAAGLAFEHSLMLMMMMMIFHHRRRWCILFASRK